MKKLLNPSSKEVKGLAIAYILIGLLICFFNVSILSICVRVIGVAILIFALYLLYVYFIQRHTTNPLPLFVGIPCALIAILLLASPESIIAMLPIITGVILIANSIVHLQKSLVLKDYGYTNWMACMIGSIIILAVGVILLCKPIQSVSFIMQIIGISLIVEAIFILISQHTLDKYEQ